MQAVGLRALSRGIGGMVGVLWVGAVGGRRDGGVVGALWMLDEGVRSCD